MGILDDLKIQKQTNPNTRDRYLLDNAFGNFQVDPNGLIALRNRQKISDEYKKNRVKFIPPEYREGYVKPDQVRPNNYDLYEFMDSPAGSTARGLIGDLGTGAANVIEAGKTGFNIMNKFAGENIAAPVADYFTSTTGQTPFDINTSDEIKSKASKLDTTFDVTKNPFPEDSLIRKLGDNKYVKEIFGFIKNQLDTGSPDIPNTSLTGNQDIGTNIVNKLDKDVNNGEIKTIDQSGVNTIVNATSKASGAAGVIADASNKVTEAVGTKEKNETTADKLKSGIDTFLNDLDKPGFQVALAMHMEAKNGGDITSVLFEGMKVKKRAEKDLLAAHINNLQTSKLELDIIKAYQSVGKTEQPQKELISALTAQFNSAPYKLGDKSGSAAYAISLMAMETAAANPGMDPYTASQLVINTLPEGVLEKNGWNPFAGGDFDPSKLATANAQINPEVVAISALQREANAQGIDIQTALQQAEDSGIIVDHMR